MTIAIIYFSTYTHTYHSALEIQKGIESAGGKADIFQIPETLSDDVLELLHAAPKADVPEVTLETLEKYDGFVFGIPTRYGNFPAQWKAFWDQTGGLWASGALHGKPFGVFTTTGTPGGGQEITIRNALSSFIHHGLIYIPLGYGEAFPYLTSFDEVHGGSPWGAGSFAGADGSRQLNETEKKILSIQGKTFYTSAVKFIKASEEAPKEATKAAEEPVEKASPTKPTEKREAQLQPAVKENESTCSKCTIM